MDDVVGALVVAGGGVLTRAEALRAGVHDTQVRRALRAGELVRAAPGTYLTTTAHPTPEAAHAARCTAVLRRQGDHISLSHYSVLACAGIPTYRCDLDVVHLATDRPGGRWRRRGAVVHALPRGVRPEQRMVPIAVALAQTGLVAGPTSFLASADAALRQGLVHLEDIGEALDLMRRTPGIAPVRAAVHRLDPRAESVGESVARDLLGHLGWATTSQYPVEVAGRRYRADLRVVDGRVLVEFDGMGKYAERGALAAEKRREADLRTAGWEVVRLIWADLRDPGRVAQLVQAAVHRSRRTARVS
ncbi:type IV toxin-antitoxin system AbiEi family antitoxin domain-containing protein [Austwickia chelonae]|uniref:type IV toxin-antitoxin system AbiEi family antitoxin domain-containing protein n=1 Tax=Austwickia chelonae TaxID=100225 RepID=UPI000E289D8F|nr:type IV toxin-antitoxin system AbiEi family antitoxin domain-containing protein [Austwickia chelonae]